MAWGKRKKELEDEEYLDDEELQDKEDIQDEDEEYDDDYEDDYEDDYYDDAPRRNPLKGVVIALVILALLLGAVCALLYMRLQTAEEKVSELTTTLSNTQTELSRAQAQVASATAAPALPTATPAPMNTTPAPTAVPAQETPAPTATPEPTPEPTPTPAALLRDAITNDMLGGAVRPQDANWFDTAKTGKVVNAWVLALHWGPGDGYYENLALNKDDVVEMLAKENGWILLRTANGQYRWANGYFLQEIEPTPAPATTDGTI